MSLPAITLVIGIDFKTVQQLEVSHRTWKKFHNEMYQWPWIVFYDGCCPAFTSYSLNDLVKRGVVAEQTKFVPWPQCIGGNSRRPKYESQRERMLSGFCYVPSLHVETEFWMKLDTDAICERPGTLYEPEWFERDAAGQHNAWIASAWPYSKPASQPGKLDDWGDTVPELADKPRLNVTIEPGSNKAIHPRMASWFSYYSTEFTKFSAGLAEKSCGVGKIPVPSQDGYHFYVAHRYGWRYQTYKMKRRGWSNVSKLVNLISASQQIMRGSGTESISPAASPENSSR